MTKLPLMLTLIIWVSSVYAEPKTVNLITNNWTSQIAVTHVTGKLLKSIGYSVEYLPSSVDEQWGALAHGLAHAQIEVWEGTMSDSFNQMVEMGKILDAGEHIAKTREDWWYPDYIESVCPGLPDWKALKRCAHLFSENGKSGEGIYIAGPWEKPDEARIRALDLGFKVNIVKQGDDLWVYLKAAYKDKKPIVLFNWTPNWVESQFSGKFVEFPIHEKACETDPSWGVNPNFVYDCGNPKGGWLKKAVWSGFPVEMPCAYEFIKNMQFSNAQISEIAALVDVEGLDHASAASQWIKNNKNVWSRWIPKTCQR